MYRSGPFSVFAMSVLINAQAISVSDQSVCMSKLYRYSKIWIGDISEARIRWYIDIAINHDGPNHILSSVLKMMTWGKNRRDKKTPTCIVYLIIVPTHHDMVKRVVFASRKRYTWIFNESSASNARYASHRVYKHQQQWKLIINLSEIYNRMKSISIKIPFVKMWCLFHCQIVITRKNNYKLTTPFCI